MKFIFQNFHFRIAEIICLILKEFKSDSLTFLFRKWKANAEQHVCVCYINFRNVQMYTNHYYTPNKVYGWWKYGILFTCRLLNLLPRTCSGALRKVRAFKCTPPTHITQNAYMAITINTPLILYIWYMLFIKYMERVGTATEKKGRREEERIDWIKSICIQCSFFFIQFAKSFLIISQL